MMKVLLNTVDLNKNGGVATYYRVVRSYFSHGVKYFTVGGLTYNESRWKTVLRMLTDYINFYNQLHMSHYDIVHLNPSLGYKAIIRDALFLLMAKRTGCKTIVFIHGWDENFEKILRKKIFFMFKKIYFKADACIVLGSVFKDRLLEMGYDKKIFVETTVVDQGIFDRSVIRKKCLTEKQYNILFLSRIEKEKGVYETLDAYNILKKKYPFVTLIFAGDGHELVAAKRYVAQNNIQNVTFSGYLRGEKKWAAFQDSDLYIFPSSYGEGMPISVLEAMAFGLPVITRAVGGIIDFFKDGKMGYLTESKDPNVYAQFMEKLVVDRALGFNMGIYNRNFAREKFGALLVAKRIENIYSEVLKVEGDDPFVKP